MAKKAENQSGRMTCMSLYHINHCQHSAAAVAAVTAVAVAAAMQEEEEEEEEEEALSLPTCLPVLRTGHEK